MFNLGKLLAGSTFDTTQTEVQQHYTEAIKPNAPAEKLWLAARPIIWFATSLPLIPTDWRQILLGFIQLGDKTWLTIPEKTVETEAT